MHRLLGSRVFPFLLRRLPVVLLVVVACLQIPLATLHGLSPWKGGGFGMFSTIDVPTYRLVEAAAVVEGEERPLELPSDPDRVRLRAAIFPTARHLRLLAEDIAPEAPRGTSEIHLRVWAVAGDPSPPRLRRVLVADARIPLEEAP